MQIEQFNIKDPWVQEFVWQHLVPTDMRFDYTKIDAIGLVYRDVLNGDCILVGSREHEVMFRCQRRNPKVAEVHVMGNGLRMRSATQAALQLGWELGYERIIVWTQHERIASILQSIGFTRDACVPRSHMENGVLVDTFALSIEKGDRHE